MSNKLELKSNEKVLPALEARFLAISSKDDGSSFFTKTRANGSVVDDYIVKVTGNINTEAGRQAADEIGALNKTKIRQVNYDKELHEFGLPGADAEGNFNISFNSMFAPKVYDKNMNLIEKSDIPMIKLRDGDSATVSVIYNTKEGANAKTKKPLTYINLTGLILNEVNLTVKDEPENLGAEISNDHGSAGA